MNMNEKDMPTINISIRDYYHGIDNTKIASGGESIICTLGEDEKLYKFFIDPRNPELTIDMPANKIRKVQALYKMHPKYMTTPTALISIGSCVVGYEMPRFLDSTTFYKAGLSLPEKIEALSKTRDILKYFATLGITYGDIKSNNILIDSNGNISFCDVDNVQVKTYPIDLVVEFLKLFSEKYGKIDENADAYMHNIFTLQQLGFPNSTPTYREIVKTVESGIYPKGFEKEAYPIFESMKTPENFNGEYVIQYVKK